MNSPKKRVVVLGAKGFVGSSIIPALDKNLYQPVAVSRSECDFFDAACEGILRETVRDGDIVVCAAAKAPAKNMDMLVENIAIISHIAEGLRGKKLDYMLNISSDAVYGDSMEKLTETSPVAPLNAHGIMHAMREYILEKTLSAPIGHLRPTLIYGEGDPHNGYGPNSFIRLAREGLSIELFGQGEEQRDHIYIGDVAKLAVGMIGQKTAGPINATTGRTISFMEIAQWTAAAVGGKINVTSKSRSGPMPHNGYRAFDNALAKRVCPGLIFQDIATYIRASASQKHAV